MNNTEFKEKAYECLKLVASKQQTLTNDDVFDYFENWPKLWPSENIDRRIYGSVVQKAIKEGIISWTGRTIVSRRKNCHQMLIRVYKSNVYKPKSWWTKFKEMW